MNTEQELILNLPQPAIQGGDGICCGNTTTGGEYMGQKETICCGQFEERTLDYYTAGQMHEYALQAIRYAMQFYSQPAPDVLGYAEGIEAVAKMLDTKADDYAKEFGFDDMGGLEFSREAQREYHSTLIDLAEDVRALAKHGGAK